MPCKRRGGHEFNSRSRATGQCPHATLNDRTLHNSHAWRNAQRTGSGRDSHSMSCLFYPNGKLLQNRPKAGRGRVPKANTPKWLRQSRDMAGSRQACSIADYSPEIRPDRVSMGGLDRR